LGRTGTLIYDEIPNVMTDSDAHAAAYRHGIDLFNQEKFFDAHEVLEDVWRDAPEPDRKFLQGLIQVAVAFHHHTRGNVVGCLSLLNRGGRNLLLYESPHGGVAIATLLLLLNEWKDAVTSGSTIPPFPKLEVDFSSHL
jgi:predicted metal-dependent hydrolase